ncbi:MAG TPA: S-adenosylmethionine:tRNA ribosyltransferase-isomerase [Terriglobia bacterium]|nr:S-adenosylmethionine:tRNA ribosyltransferase-isomerase [Terriglobia bacterium]
MIPAREPRTPRDAARLLVLDPEGGTFEDTLMPELPRFLRPGDLLVVNDAATLPASLRARTASGVEAEIRLLGQIENSTWKAAVFGPGDWRTPTELRDPPERVTPGSVLSVGESLAMEVVEVSPDSPRLITVRFDRSGEDLWTALYAFGKPIQYSYLSKDLALWSVQTVYAARPWAVEMPSAGEALSWRILLALRRKGVRLAYLTHAAGLSATGDEDLDALLPLAERFEIPGSTVEAIEATHVFGGRVVAVGTTVVRALEGCAAQHSGKLIEGAGMTGLVITKDFSPRVVDGLLTGIHEPSQSHFRLLRAFTDETSLRRAWRHAAEIGYLGHEFGDACLILREGPEK